MTLRFHWQVWSILSNVRIILLGRKLIFYDLLFMCKLHYCFMREACQFASFEQNTSAEMYPLHYILCSVTGGRGYVGKDRCGLCPRCHAAHVTSLPAWSQADRQQLCTPGAISPARHGHLSWRPAPSAPFFLKHEAGLRWGCSESPPLAKAAWASPWWVWSSASSRGNERRSWLVHLIDWLMIFQHGYKSSLISVSFSWLNTKEIPTSSSLPC